MKMDKDGVVVGLEPIKVCKVCGPKSLHIACRIISVVCEKCRETLSKAWKISI